MKGRKRVSGRRSRDKRKVTEHATGTAPSETSKRFSFDLIHDFRLNFESIAIKL